VDDACAAAAKLSLFSILHSFAMSASNDLSNWEKTNRIITSIAAGKPLTELPVKGRKVTKTDEQSVGYRNYLHSLLERKQQQQLNAAPEQIYNIHEVITEVKMSKKTFQYEERSMKNQNAAFQILFPGTYSKCIVVTFVARKYRHLFQEGDILVWCVEPSQSAVVKHSRINDATIQDSHRFAWRCFPEHIMKPQRVYTKDGGVRLFVARLASRERKTDASAATGTQTLAGKRKRANVEECETAARHDLTADVEQQQQLPLDPQLTEQIVRDLVQAEHAAGAHLEELLHEAEIEWRTKLDHHNDFDAFWNEQVRGGVHARLGYHAEATEWNDRDGCHVALDLDEWDTMDVVSVVGQSVDEMGGG